MLSHRRSEPVVLAFLFGLSAPPPGSAQSVDGISPAEIELIGLTVDIEDRKRLGSDCQWAYPGTQVSGCAITYATIERAGFGVVSGKEISMTEGDFGLERYRMAGRVTDLHYREAIKVYNRDNYIEQQGELIVDTDGRVLGRMPTVRIRARGGEPMPAQVTATVEWSVYDKVTEQILLTKKIKGRDSELGNALYDSMDKFVEGLLEE